MGHRHRMITQLKKSEKYKYVYLVRIDQEYIEKWRAQIGNIMWCKYYDSEIEAAKGVDLKLIQLGKNPVNIFKKAI